ncbi:uncharacterized protein KGF55_004400 [Candida pseudojiufengensis]|uniref:uncharacterized protein n=1 Tax=Candida pseudojiufengensis TaxID=497109 RepID=UPI00222434B6|nr:uncharacterized protein KGF55_004400 [Candida pseudojiufengensis]KAI5960830.1 hypothetical protein KGF55_004400 [Candida pseudojiufengensis]
MAESIESIYSRLSIDERASNQNTLNSETPPSSGEDELQNENENSQNSLISVYPKIFHACQLGDFDVVDSLLSTPDLNINELDEYNNSLLYTASLRGYYDIVELLLKRGAVCDRDTFQGARCIYGALTDEIRDLLIGYDFSKAVDVNQPFAGHVSSFLTSSSNKDIYFKFNQMDLNSDLSGFALHRFLLAARSPYFMKKFTNDWKSLSVIQMPNDIDPQAFKGIIDYIYLRTDSMAITNSKLHSKILALAKKYELHDLVEGVNEVFSTDDEKEQYKIKHALALKFVEKARKDLSALLENEIILQKHSLNLALKENVELEDIDCQNYINEEIKEKLLNLNSIPDVILANIDSVNETITYYPAHKSILARSEYFDTMFKSDIFKYAEEDIPTYKEGQISVVNRPQLEAMHLPVIRLSWSSSNEKVDSMVLSYLYHDDVDTIPLENTVELLFAADELFLERLKTIAAVRISSHYTKFSYKEFTDLKIDLDYDAYDLIRIAWQTRCDKLEQHITKMIAYNLQKIYEDDQESSKLSTLINDSAARIKERQVTDTIELVDDIRYYLSKKYALGDDHETFDPAIGLSEKRENIKLYQMALIDYNRDIEVIDQYLDALNLDA